MSSSWNMLNNDLCYVFSGVFARLRYKILFPYRFANFSDIFLSIVSNYLCNRCSYLISTLDFQRYDPCMLTQYITDNDENVVITFVELCVRAHLDHISLSQIIISVNYNCVENFFLSERAVLPPVVTFRDFSFQICYDYCMMRKTLQSS